MSDSKCLNVRKFFIIIAVATHKFVISFSVGLELATSGTRTALHVMYMTTWALASPIGIAIGIAISEGKGEYNYTTNAVLQGKIFKNKTSIINDPLGQTHNLDGSVNILFT